MNTYNISDLTLGQIKEITSLFDNSKFANSNNNPGLNTMVGNKVIVRTSSAGVHFGEIVEKSGTEVILKNSRRLYYWKVKNGGISLSEVANEGLASESKVCSPVSLLWLNAIELIKCQENAIINIEEQDEYRA